ncbi:MAG: hypothetical protein GX542_01065 [Rhodococcus sp.]|nr:hypothetical protein [Rhodococcus sp. (in: high G+C Gram-positive bacteria)]
MAPTPRATIAQLAANPRPTTCSGLDERRRDGLREPAGLRRGAERAAEDRVPDERAPEDRVPEDEDEDLDVDERAFDAVEDAVRAPVRAPLDLVVLGAELRALVFPAMPPG